MNMVRPIKSILNKKVFCFLLVSVILQHRLAIAQDKEIIYEFGEDIVVTASRIPTAFPNVARSIIIIDRQAIELIPANSVEDLLGYISGVDVQQRGPHGVQADISIRGASFEQTLVLIDGVKISDPQTGHHNMNLPLSIEDIEKIEILKGHGSRLYGPNAFGGVINIITRKAETQQVSIKTIYGSHNFYNGLISLQVPMGISNHRFSVSKRASDGYRENTDFNILTTSYGSQFKIGENILDFSAGYIDKKFGANSFYTPKFPNQWERTKATYVKTGFEFNGKRIKFSPKIHWRQHTDEFMLKRNNPEFYHNLHTTNVYGFEFNSNLFSSIGITSVGGEFGKEEIESNNLGNHNRGKGGVFLEHQFAFKKIRITPGWSVYNYSGWDWHAWPGIDLGYKLNSFSSLYVSIGKAFRVPTFTELYYSDPVNKGNADLKEEMAWNYEIGYKLAKAKYSANIALFSREGKNLIDWVKLYSDDIWYAVNLTEVNSTGLEFSMQYSNFNAKTFFNLNNIHLSYSYINSDKNTGGRLSKYILNHHRHQIIAGINQNLFLSGLSYTLKFRYKERPEYKNQFLMDGRLSWKNKRIEIFVDGTNLLNKSYEDYDFIPMPGRWLKAGLTYDLL